MYRTALQRGSLLCVRPVVASTPHRMAVLASSSRGYAHAVDVLTNDHKEVKRLFSSIENAKDQNEISKHLQLLVENLSKHAELEEQVLYPALRNLSGKPDLADRSLTEHQRMKDALYKLDQTPSDRVGDREFMATFKQLKEETLHHIEEEEGEVFEVLKQRMGAQDLEDMGSLIETLKPMAPTHPHPSAPNTPPWNTMAAPLASFMDRMKDLGRKMAGKA
ncbi:DNA nickase [Balamuthia mandrillaris]